jgi:hypothetical protein
MLRAGLKAGIIIGMVLAVVDLILLLTRFEWVGAQVCLLYLLVPVLWFISGILASRFGAAALTTAAAAGTGSLAGAIAVVVVRMTYVVTNLTMLALGVVSVPFSPGSIQWLAQLGLRAGDGELSLFAEMRNGYAVWTDPATVDRASACMFCVGLSVAVAAGLGALGGIVGRARAGRRRA